MRKHQSSPWSWIPSLYFAEGLPYVVVMTLSVIMYKRLGVSNTDIALYTSWLYLPWVIKPFWSPVVDLLKTKRWWILMMQLVIGAALGGVALTIPLPGYFQYTLLFFWLLAFSSATHDIAADGFYMLGLEEHEQSYFVGIRSTFYRLAMITGQGLLIIMAGAIESGTGLKPLEFRVSAGNNGISDIHHKADMGDFVLQPADIRINLDGLPADSAMKMQAWAASQNQINGFTPVVEVSEHQPSWWNIYVSRPLQDYLKSHFGNQQVMEQHERVGGIAIIGIALKHEPEPGEAVVLNLDWLKGDRDLKLVGNARLVFDAHNRDKTAWVLVQADNQLSHPAQAWFKGRSGNIPLAWMSTFVVLALLFMVFVLYHQFMLPKSSNDGAKASGEGFVRDFVLTFRSFFKKPEAVMAILFIMLFRLGESQLVKIASLFLLDSRTTGGLGLTTGQVGLVYGTIGIVSLTFGGIIGGWLVSRRGLRYWIWPMALAINLPNIAYVYLAYFTPDSIAVIAGCVAVEQFGYGFGFTAFMLYLIYFSEGENKTAHYAICTGLMALGMMIPGMVSGWLQEIIGYRSFFIWVMLCTVPGLVVVRYLKIDALFGQKH